jgi:glycosyltransferase involved in cell wall biosynthesis
MKISLVTATYQCVGVVADCLDTVEAQEVQPYEHLLIDGASTDGTLAILESRAGSLSTLLSEPDNGIYDALNKGIHLSTGDVVGFLHADDLFADDCVLGDVVSAFESDPSLGAIYGDLIYVNRHEPFKVIRRWRSQPFTPHLLQHGWMPPHPTLYVRREWYQRLGGFDESYQIAADYRFILNLFSQPGFRSQYLPRVMIKMRTGGLSNRSASSLMQKSSEDWRALRESGLSAPQAFVALGLKNFSKLGQFWR